MGTFPQIDAVLAKLQVLGIELSSSSVRLGAYGDSEIMSKELLELIRQGHKRAGTALLWALEAENESLPAIGEIEVVLDYCYEPAIVTRILSVDIVPFEDVTAEYAAIEGEGDGSLQHWRKVHWEYFSRECKSIGCESLMSMPVVCSVFEVLNVLPAQPAA